jgi:hypothetical protein
MSTLNIIYLLVGVNALVFFSYLTFGKPDQSLKKPYGLFKWISITAAIAMFGVHIYSFELWAAMLSLLFMGVFNWIVFTRNHYFSPQVS